MKEKKIYKLPKGYRKFFAYKADTSIVVMANRKDSSAVFIFDGINPIFTEMMEGSFKYRKL